MTEYLKVKDYPHLVRDLNSRAIVNTDVSAYETAVARAKARKAEIQKSNTRSFHRPSVLATSSSNNNNKIIRNTYYYVPLSLYNSVYNHLCLTSSRIWMSSCFHGFDNIKYRYSSLSLVLLLCSCVVIFHCSAFTLKLTPHLQKLQ